MRPSCEPYSRPPAELEQLVAQRERRLEALERDALSAQQVADALEGGDGQQPGQNWRIAHVEFAHHELAFCLQARLLPDDGRFELQLAPSIRLVCVQRLQKIAGVGGGQTELLPPPSGVRVSANWPPLGSLPREVGRAPAIRVADEIGVHGGEGGSVDDQALGLQVQPQRRLEPCRAGSSFRSGLS